MCGVCLSVPVCMSVPRRHQGLGMSSAEGAGVLPENIRLGHISSHFPFTSAHPKAH